MLEGDLDDLGFEVHGPRYGPDWIDWASSPAIYCRIEPRRMFALRLPGA